jgi:DNA-binding NarL/FixJ family response regulator
MIIKIGLVEDNPHLARSLKENLSAFENVEVLFVASNGEEALHKLFSNNPDILLMDINMPIMDGIEATKRIKHQFPNIKIIMLTIFSDGDNIFNSILAGASGYLLKDEKPGKILDALEESMEGGSPMTPVIATKTLQFIRGRNPDVKQKNEEYNLTKREIEILEFIAKGETYLQIANKIFISPKTVRKHIENIYVKLHVHNKVDAVRLSLDKKII